MARAGRSRGVTRAAVVDAYLPGMEPVVPACGSMSVPFYESDRVRLFLADARDVLPTLAPVDLLVSDPPYGVAWDSGMRKVDPFGPMAGDDGTLDVLGVLASVPLRNNRHVYVFGYTVEEVRRRLDLGGTAELIWDKDQVGLGDLSRQWSPSFERIVWGVSTNGTTEQTHRGNLAARLRRGSVLRCPKVSGAANRHPTEKPVELMRLLVESSSLPGETVLDPFAGSGSTLVAAILCGRKAVGIEVDPRYAQTAAARCRRAEAVADQMAGL